MNRRQIFLTAAWLWATILGAQNKVTTVGFQIKPIITAPLFGTGPQEISNLNSGMVVNVVQNTGYTAGMSIRKGFEKNFSLEFGINFCRRNLNISTDFQNSPSNNRLRIIGYELPLAGLFFVRLSERVYMNVGTGFCMNIFPSDVINPGEPLYVYAGRRISFNPGLLAQTGIEYRSVRSGYFYLGASFNRPFFPIYELAVDYTQNQTVISSIVAPMRGTYLTADLRYYFHESPERKKAKLPSEKKGK
ncbi:MAG: hypothetical protein ACK5CY_09525 [Bacteroidia bacterium]